MKLIIDIPTDTYNILMKHKGFYTTTTIFSAITNGIPYEERPKGEWKLDSIGAYCSICETHPDYATNFCPICGADMRKGGAEE